MIAQPFYVQAHTLRDLSLGLGAWAYALWCCDKLEW